MTTRLTRGLPADWLELERHLEETCHDEDWTEWAGWARQSLAHPFFAEACARQAPPWVIAHYMRLNRPAVLPEPEGQETTI